LGKEDQAIFNQIIGLMLEGEKLPEAWEAIKADEESLKCLIATFEMYAVPEIKNLVTKAKTDKTNKGVEDLQLYVQCGGVYWSQVDADAAAEAAKAAKATEVTVPKPPTPATNPPAKTDESTEAGNIAALLQNLQTTSSAGQERLKIIGELEAALAKLREAENVGAQALYASVTQILAQHQSALPATTE